jgi:hypothetical protein
MARELGDKQLPSAKESASNSGLFTGYGGRQNILEREGADPSDLTMAKDRMPKACPDGTVGVYQGAADEVFYSNRIGCLPFDAFGGIDDIVQKEEDIKFIDINDVPENLRFGVFLGVFLRTLEYGSDEYNAALETGQQWTELLKRYENGEAGLRDLRNFDGSGLEGWGQWGDIYNEAIDSASVLDENADIREILRSNGYSDEEIDEILSAEVKTISSQATTYYPTRCAKLAILTVATGL